MNDELVHKRKPAATGPGPRSVCGRYGFTTLLWRNVTCDLCRKARKVSGGR
jgi:hypothetical protein